MSEVEIYIYCLGVLGYCDVRKELCESSSITNRLYRYTIGGKIEGKDVSVRFITMGNLISGRFEFFIDKDVSGNYFSHSLSTQEFSKMYLFIIRDCKLGLLV